ncbi:MAG: hypothetical protein MJ135_01000 [Oscillospiraceae bacterium]|nr:hypothetical protein [Oscillospiraceae bacterium]
MKKLKKKLLKLLLRLLLIVIGFIAVTFTVYIFNLDMKLTAAMEPILFKFYDRVKRDQHL